MSWTDEKIEELKKLWAKGLSTAEIGRELGVSKNAVVGKSHRLALKPRPSPISGKSAEPAAPGAPKAAAAPAKPKVAKAAKPKEVAKIGDIIDLGPQMCRWPFGDPGDDDFHFCGRQVTPSKPYCPEHCAVAYVTKSSSRDRSHSSSSSQNSPVRSPPVATS